MTTIVVGIEDSLRGQDAVALAGDLARSTGAELLAVCAYPFDERPSARFNSDMREPLRRAAETILARLCEPLSDVPHVRRAVADPTPARALIDAAVEADAALLVVGSSHSGFSGITKLGNTGSRLLNGAPCAVAIAPQGQRLRPHPAHGRVTVAFDGSPEARAAVAVAAPLAQATGHSLRLATVFDADLSVAPWLHVPPGFLRMTDEAEQAARSELQAAVEAVPGAEAAFLVGDPARELARETEVSELLVVGSRGYGPAPAVLLGEVSSRLVESAACPVLIVPHAVGSDLHDRGQLLSQLAV